MKSESCLILKSSNTRMHFIWGKFKKKVRYEKVRALCNMLTEDFMRDIGIKMFDMETVTKDISLEMSIEERFLMEKLMEEESMNGGTVRYMMEIGQQDSKKDKAFGRTPKEIIILENGKILRLMVMVYISGLMETSMKASGLDS